MYRKIFETYLKNCIVKGSDSGGLEPCIVSGDGENESLGSFIFRSTYDIWKLCVIQFAGSHIGGRIFKPGKNRFCY